MKKLLSLATLLAISSSAVAGFNGGTDAPKSTVAQALKSKQDDAPIQLTGKIVRQIDNDEFMFRDATGEIKIEVEDNAWQGANVTQNDTITIFGKIDYERVGTNSVDVFRVQK